MDAPQVNPLLQPQVVAGKSTADADEDPAVLAPGASNLLGRSPSKTFRQRNRVLAMAKCGDCIVTGGAQDGEIAVSEIATGNLLTVLHGHTNSVNNLFCYSERLWSAGADAQVRCWKSEPPFTALGHTIISEGPVLAVCAGYPRRLYVLPERSRRVLTLSAEHLGRIKPTVELAETVTAIASCDGLLWTATTGLVAQHDRDGTVLKAITLPLRPALLLVSRKMVVVVDGVTLALRHRTGYEIGRVKLPQGARCMVLSEDKGTIVAGLKDGSVRVYSIQKQAEIDCLRGHERPVNALLQSCGELLSGGTDKQINVWDAEDLVGSQPKSSFEDPHTACCVVQ